MDKTAPSPLQQDQTAFAYALMRILDTPFWGLFNLLPVMAYKNLGATPLQLGIMITLKPLVALFSSYWTSFATKNPQRFVQSITAARWLAFLPFLFFPFASSAWFIIACFALFMFFQLGMVPLWMELLSRNLPKERREKLFSYAQAFGHLGGGLFPFAIGWVLDEWADAWRWMFVLTACLALASQWWLRKLTYRPIVSLQVKEPPSHPLLHPWTKSWNLLRCKPEFTAFQIGFMLLGAGLMMIQPALPMFFVDTLQLSYTEMGVAMTLCKGIAFALSSPVWANWLKKVDLFTFSALIALLAAAFPLILEAAAFHIGWLYIAYMAYGCMQSGNELGWNMSGPIFAKGEDSSSYTAVNIIAIGLRGMCIPLMGSALLMTAGPSFVLYTCCLFCLFGSLWMAHYRRKENEANRRHRPCVIDQH